MNPTCPTCTGARSGAEEAERRERAKGNAGRVRVERRVRPRVIMVMVDNNLVSNGIHELQAMLVLTKIAARPGKEGD